MKKISLYKCEICGKTFIEDPSGCREHELNCNKCNSCDHAYYVYGCEFRCEHNDAGSCGPKKGFCRYKCKNNKNVGDVNNG